MTDFLSPADVEAIVGHPVPTKAEKVTSARIVAALRARYTGERKEWAFFDQLRTGTGGAYERTLDAFAFHTWPSQGYRSIAFEVKVTRADFMREVTDPTKREPAERLAGECFFATPAGLLRPDEVPEGWGLMELRADGSVAVRKAAAQRKPEPWPLAFVACIARRSAETPSRLPVAAWTYAGKELTEDALLDLAEGLAGRAVARAENRGRHEAQGQAREAMGQLYALQGALRDVAGEEATTPEGFRAWAASNRPGLPASARMELRRLRDGFARVVRAIEPEGEGAR